MPMSHPFSPALRRSPAARIGAAGIALVAGLLLAGCSPAEDSSGGPVEPSGSNAPSVSASPDASASATPVVTPTPEPGIPVTLPCETLVPAQALYDFNPNFTIDPSYEPAAETLPATLEADEGVVCGYLNQTSGEVIEVALAHLQPAELQKVKDALVVEHDPVPTYGGDEAYFTVEDGHGQAQAFTGDYWIVARSTAFYEPGDHAGLMAAIIDAVATAQP